jgi:phosphomannomutase/phosphoglucomutase
MTLFGTNGIRGVLNESLDPEMGYKFGMAVGTYYDTEDIALGYDNRTTSDIFRTAIESGVLNSGKNVIDLGMVPTPAVQIYCKLHKIPGIMVTASHNPSEFNGFKIIAIDGSNPGKEDEAKVEDIMTKESFVKTTWDFVGRIRNDDAIYPYINEILKNVAPNRIRGKRFRVLVDCANSTTLVTTPLLLRKLGTRYVSINGNPDGSFPGRDPEPSEDNIRDMRSLARIGGFDLSVAHDGDGDRATFLDEKGDLIDGDKFVALVADHILEQQKGDLVFPVASSFLIDRIAEKHGVRVVRTAVGAPMVSDVLTKIHGLMGGEENGKVILPKYLNAGDGGLSVAMALDLMSSTNMEISKLIKQLPDYKLKRIKIAGRTDFESIKGKIKDFYKKMEADEIDGLRLVDRDSFILIRKSGTEPVIRIYLSSMDPDWINAREREVMKFLSG